MDSFLSILLKTPPPCLVQAQGVLSRLFLAPDLLGLAITIHVLAAQQLGSLLLFAQERPEGTPRSAAQGRAERAGDLFEGCADGAKAGFEGFA